MDHNNPFATGIIEPKNLLNSWPYTTLIALPSNSEGILEKCKKPTCMLLGEALYGNWGHRSIAGYRHRIGEETFPTQEAAAQAGQAILLAIYPPKATVSLQVNLITVEV